MENKNRILIDWFTFTTRKDSLSKIFDVIGISQDNFIDIHKGYNGYKSSLYFEGISVCYDGSRWVDDKGKIHDMGIMVNICGTGCRTFEDNSSKSFKELFEYISERLDDYNITRLDVAFDDFERVLDIKQISEDVKKKNYVSRFRSVGIDWSRKEDIEASTVYFGSEKSDLMYRMYDKKAEQKIIDDSMHWVRFEMQCRNTHSETFVELICQDFDISEVFFNVLNNQLRFVVPSEADSNKRRWATSPYWENFLQYKGIQSLYKAPGQEYNDDNLLNYLNTYSGALYSLCSFYGVEFLLHFLKKRSIYKFNSKYESFLISKGVRLSSLPAEIDLYLGHLDDNLEYEEELKKERKKRIEDLKAKRNLSEVKI